MYTFLFTLWLKLISYITTITKQTIARLFKANNTGQYPSCMKANSYLEKQKHIIRIELWRGAYFIKLKFKSTTLLFW